MSRYAALFVYRGPVDFDAVEDFLAKVTSIGSVSILKFGVIADRLIVVARMPTANEFLAVRLNCTEFAAADTKRGLQYNQLPPLNSEYGQFPESFDEAGFRTRFAEYLK
jgi:hypothetical protein